MGPGGIDSRRRFSRSYPALSGNNSPADDREEVDGSLTASTGNACGVLVPLVP